MTSRQHTAALAAALMMMIATSCSTEQPETPAAAAGQGLQPLLLTTAVSAPEGGGTLGTTRTTVAGANVAKTPQNTVLDAGQTLRVYFSGGNIVKADGVTEVTSAEMETLGGGSIKTTTKINGTALASGDDHKLYYQMGEVQTWIDMYYPMQDQATTPVATGPAMTSFTVAQDQSGDVAYKASDLMFGSGTLETERTLGNYNQKSPNVTLRHRMAQLLITATSSGAGNVVAVRVIRGFRTVSISNPKTATPGTTLTTPITRELPLTAHAAGASATAYCACLVPPQTVAKGDFIEVETQQGTATFRLTDDKALASGTSYALALTVSPATLGATTDITDWGPGGGAQHQSSQQMLSFYVGGVPFNMVFVEGGDFSMKMTKNLYSNADQSKVTITGSLSDYYIGETEVTEALYTAVTGTANPGNNRGPNYPITNIYPITTAPNFDTFVSMLNTLTEGQRPAGWHFAKTTEMQWQYAARGGKYSQGYPYAGGTVIDNIAVVGRAEGDSPNPVATKLPNELGLYDMVGNVCEIQRDLFVAWTGDTNVGLDFCRTSGGTNPVARDASFRFSGNSSNNMRSYETRNHGTKNFDDLGMRLALVHGWGYGYTGAVQTFTAPKAGKYRIECWGAQGGDAAIWVAKHADAVQVKGGRGGYATGVVSLNANDNLYVYVGQEGRAGVSTADSDTEIAWNGGGKGGGRGSNTEKCDNTGGGGATDVRTATGDWNANFDKRIIVAGGGGGSTSYGMQDTYWNNFSIANSWGIVANGGYGGGAAGGDGWVVPKDASVISSTLVTSTGTVYNPPTHWLATGGTQTAGGRGGYFGSSTLTGTDGSLGTGGSSTGWGGGGGGGYYGGGGGGYNGGVVGTGAGGSSYTGGVTGGMTIAGNSTMPAPGGGNELGHSGNGYCRITYVGQ